MHPDLEADLAEEILGYTVVAVLTENSKKPFVKVWGMKPKADAVRLAARVRVAFKRDKKKGNLPGVELVVLSIAPVWKEFP